MIPERQGKRWKIQNRRVWPKHQGEKTHYSIGRVNEIFNRFFNRSRFEYELFEGC